MEIEYFDFGWFLGMSRRLFTICWFTSNARRWILSMSPHMAMEPSHQNYHHCANLNQDVADVLAPLHFTTHSLSFSFLFTHTIRTSYLSYMQCSLVIHISPTFFCISQFSIYIRLTGSRCIFFLSTGRVRTA